MSGLDDLGRALRDDAAANAPGASAIDVDAVARAARARRRPRLLGAGALAIIGTLGLGGLAVSAWPAPVLIAASESAQDGDDAPAAADGADLGDPARGPAGQAEAGGGAACGSAAPRPMPMVDGLRVEVDLPAGAPGGLGPGSAEGLTGVARLVSTGPEPRTVAARTSATAVLLQNGVAVGAEGFDSGAVRSIVLEPGVPIELPVRLVTVACSDGDPLPPGDYAALVTVDVGEVGGAPGAPLGVILPVRID